MVEFNTPLKYHMNDLVYYYGVSTGGSLSKQIAFLCAIGAMMKGMMYMYSPDAPDVIEGLKSIDSKKRDAAEKIAEGNRKIQSEIDTYIKMTDMLSMAHSPLIDSNPYLFKKAARIRKGVNIAAVLGFHIIEKHNLVAGNIIRGRLAEHFGKDRIKGDFGGSQNED